MLAAAIRGMNLYTLRAIGYNASRIINSFIGIWKHINRLHTVIHAFNRFNLKPGEM